MKLQRIFLKDIKKNLEISGDHYVIRNTEDICLTMDCLEEEKVFNRGEDYHILIYEGRLSMGPKGQEKQYKTGDYFKIGANESICLHPLETTYIITANRKTKA